MVEVFDIESIFGGGGCLVDDGVGQWVARDVKIGRFDVDVGGVCAKEVEAVEI